MRGEIADIDRLGLMDAPAHKEFGAERFVAAIERGKADSAQFQIAYLLGAVSPGVFAYPAAIRDTYRSDPWARTASGKLAVIGPSR